MANEEHLAILRQGVETWNQWRNVHPAITPNLNGADVRWMDLRGANFQWSQLNQARLDGAKLDSADFSGADLNKALMNGVHLYNADFSSAHLNEADLSRAELSKVNFFGAGLSRAILRGANLSGAILFSTNISEADLVGANLSEAYLMEANLNKANLVESDLRWANLSGVNLNEADVRGAVLDVTLFANVDLSSVKGLDQVFHWGPSTIGIDTLYKSRGKIPEIFLRGAGVPEALIAYLPSLITNKAIQYYSCFISYSSKDEEFARRLHADLRARGVRVWFAPEDIKGGKKLHEQIPEAIRLYDKLLLVLSENSMHSEWVKTEIRHARKTEAKENRRKLFPISLVEYSKIQEWEAPDDTSKDMAVEVREYYIPDFSRWKEQDAYQAAFERLMRDLNLEEGG